MTRSFVPALACALLLLLMSAASASAAVPGVNVSRIDATGDPYVNDPATANGDPSDGAAAWKDIVDSHARTVRAFYAWNATDPATLDKYAAFARKAHARGLDVELVVTGTPTSMATPAAYARAVGTIAAHLQGQVVAYEVWNEPDDTQFWKDGPQPADYAALLKAAYKAIKAADPATQVLIGGLVANDYGFVSDLYDDGAKGSFDGVAVHTDTACNATDPTSYYREPSGRIGRYAFTGYREIRSTMLAHGDVEPIWMSELGWSSSSGACAVGDKVSGVGQAAQADFLTRAYECLANDPYVVQALWWNLHDFNSGSPDYPNQLGLVDDSFARKPAFAAFAQAGSAQPIPCGGTLDSSTPTVSFITPNDKTPYYSSLPVKVHADDDQGVKDINLFLDGKYIPLGVQIHGTSADLSTMLGKAGQLGFGPHELVAKARDETRNWGTARITIVRVGGGGYTTRIPASLVVHLGKVRRRRMKVSGHVNFGGGVRGDGRVEMKFQRLVKGVWRTKNVRHRAAHAPFRYRFAFNKAGRWRVTTRFLPHGPFQRRKLPAHTLRVR